MSIKNIDAINDEMRKVNERLIKLTQLTQEIKDEEDITEMLKSFAQMKKLHDKMNDIRKKWYASLEDVSRNTIPDRFMDTDVKSMNIDGYGRFQVGSNYSVKVLDDQKSKDWLIENGGEDLIKETVNSSSLKAWMKEFKEEKGMSPPDDIYSENIASYTQIQTAK